MCVFVLVVVVVVMKGGVTKSLCPVAPRRKLQCEFHAQQLGTIGDRAAYDDGQDVHEPKGRGVGVVGRGPLFREMGQHNAHRQNKTKEEEEEKKLEFAAGWLWWGGGAIEEKPTGGRKKRWPSMGE